MPHTIVRSIWARSSRSTSAGSACSQRSAGLRGNPPSPDSNEGACVIGPQRYAACSALSVRCTPMSSVGCALSAAWRAHGAGTMIDVHVAIPSRIAW